MATLRKIGRKYFAYFYDKNRSPRRKSVALGTGLKSAAERKLIELEHDFVHGKFDPWAADRGSQANPTLDDAAARFLAVKNDLRPQTQLAYRLVLDALQDCLGGSVPLSDITTEPLRPYLLDDAVSTATRRHRIRHANVFFRWAVDSGLLEVNPVGAIRPPRRENKVPEFLSAEELSRLLRAIEVDVVMKREGGLVQDGEVLWLRELVIIAVNTGLRRGELLNLAWDDVDLDQRLLTVRNRDGFRTKSGHERQIPISPQAHDVFEQMDGREGKVFKGLNGGPLNARYVSRRFKYYVRLAKLPERIRFHSLRHTCASWLVQSGVSLPIVQAILGHADLSTTQRYAHLSPSVLRAAIETTFSGHPSMLKG